MRLESVRPIPLPVTLSAHVRFILPGVPRGRAARRMFSVWRTTLTISHDEAIVDGGRRGGRRSVRLDEVRYIKVWGASPLLQHFTTVDVATTDGVRLWLAVRRPRRLLSALRACGLELFTNPAWPGVYAAARFREDVDWA